MEKNYIKPEIEIIVLAKDLMQAFPEDSGQISIGNMDSKQNDMWEESSDPVFDTNKKNLWDE